MAGNKKRKGKEPPEEEVLGAEAERGWQRKEEGEIQP